MLLVLPGWPRVATLLRLYTDKPSRDGGARAYPPRDGGSDGDSGGDIPDLALNRFPGVERESAERLLGFWPPMCICGDPAAGAALPDA
jgi:hypothetical protein